MPEIKTQIEFFTLKLDMSNEELNVN